MMSAKKMSDGKYYLAIRYGGNAKTGRMRKGQPLKHMFLVKHPGSEKSFGGVISLGGGIHFPKEFIGKRVSFEVVEVKN